MENTKQISTAIEAGNLTKLLESLFNTAFVHVNRVDFLKKVFKVTEDDIRSGNYQVSLKQRKALAERRIHTNVIESSSASFVAGLPGGFAMAGMIPADIMQNMVFSLRLAQELAYIYDYDDVIDQDGELQIDGVILFLGIMFGAQGAGSLVRIASKNVGQYISKKILNTALTKNAWYPLLKKISIIVAGKTMTKKGLAGIATKAIPIVGGGLSAGMTAVTMEVAGKKLNLALVRGLEDYDDEAFEHDCQIVEAEFEEIRNDENNEKK